MHVRVCVYVAAFVRVQCLLTVVCVPLCMHVHAGMYVHCQSLMPTIYGITCRVFKNFLACPGHPYIECVPIDSLIYYVTVHVKSWHLALISVLRKTAWNSV